MKIKNNILLVSVLMVAFLASSCSKSYLDDVDSDWFTEKDLKQAQSTPSELLTLVEADFLGVYQHTYNFMNSERRADDERGLSSLFLCTDLYGKDVVMNNYNWFRFDYQQDNHNDNYRRSGFLWNLNMKNIVSANRMIETYFPDPSKLTEETKSKYAALRALRGVSYFYLVNLFQGTYKGNEDEPGIPIYKTTTDKAEKRNSVKEVYDLIVDDLTFAVENGAITDDNPEDLDKRVAAYYLAMSYAMMEDWVKVEQYSKIAYEGSSIDLPNCASLEFTSVETPGVIWGYDVNAETTLMWSSLYAIMDNTLGMYTKNCPYFIYKPLYKKISKTDLRRQQFAPEVSYTEVPAPTAENPKATKKEYNKEELKAYKEFLAKYPNGIAGTSEFTGNLASVKFASPQDVTGDLVYLRAVNPYLLCIEALVEQGKDAEAKAMLTEMMKTRDPKYDVNAITDLREEVRTQRRIELWLEGTSFFDIKRWKQGINRNEPDSNHRVISDIPAYPEATVPYRFAIPKREIDTNPGFVQNELIFKNKLKPKA